MIYLLYGSDPVKSRAKLHDVVASLIKKKPDASHIRITDEDFTELVLEEYISSAGLFASKTIVELDTVFRNKDAKEIVIARLLDIKESENIFVILEGELNKTDLKKFEKHAEKIQEFGEPGPKGEMRERKDFNIFSLTDALGRRDRKQLWVLYTKAKRKNIADEEIHGILFWQIKAMLLSASSKSAKESGLNPFVYQKSSGFLKLFSVPELKAISSRLVTIYHDARRGIREFGPALEKFILEV